MPLKPLAHRVSNLSPSPTLAITARAAAMRSQGLDVVSFAAGEPDFATPIEIIEAANIAMREGFTRYTAGSGIRELRERIAQKFTSDNGIESSADSVVVTCGAKHALIDAILALVDPGDEVIILAPYWMTYSEQVSVAGGTPVLVHCRAENAFVPDVADVEAAITPRTKAMMLCSPNNPTGAVWPKSTIASLAEVAVRHGVWIISDEVYEKLIYEGAHTSPAALAPEIAAQTITIGSCSKTFSMTGWRLGFMTGPLWAMQKVSCVQDAITHPTSFVQKSALEALNLDGTFLSEAVEEYRRRRDLMHGMISAIPGVSPHKPPGAFYIFADFSAYLGGAWLTDLELAEYLLQSAQVAVIPGSVFSAPGYLRLSYATDSSSIERGVARIQEALAAVHA